ncbi:unnamed protein product [Brachionus calyciflorus]|uniref:Tc1-like transposase DDE domain-containing protein n=1 Tax=Brachionus calyciflorus TaxID=104777 RepID=A0A814MMA9_9BILA|nr:unnamed protein product [Brachionus calyciflorus]
MFQNNLYRYGYERIIETHLKNLVNAKLQSICLETPAQSPDINVIELVWSDLKRFVRSKQPKTVDDIVKSVRLFEKSHKKNVKIIRKQRLKHQVWINWENKRPWSFSRNKWVENWEKKVYVRRIVEGTWVLEMNDLGTRDDLNPEGNFRGQQSLLTVGRAHPAYNSVDPETYSHTQTVDSNWRP